MYVRKCARAALKASNGGIDNQMPPVLSINLIVPPLKSHNPKDYIMLCANKV